MPQASRAARRLSAKPVPTSKSRESEAAMVNGYWLLVNGYWLLFIGQDFFSVKN
jgi:hypothetical protein